MWPFGPVTLYNKPLYSGPVTHYNIPSQKKNPRIFQSLGRSPGTIRPLAKFFAFLLSLGRLPKIIWSVSKKKKKVIFQITYSLRKKSYVNLLFSRFFFYLLFFINLLHKAKEKWNFSISLYCKYYKEGATVITNFWTNNKKIKYSCQWG
jgi:hypothetical protein